MDKFLYEAIVRNATDAVLVTEASLNNAPDGPRILFVNDAYLKMTGYSREEVIGKTPRILQGPGTDRRELDKLRRAQETGRPGRAELLNYRKNGEAFWTDISIFPVLDKSGKPRYYVGIKRDITDRKNELKELNTLFQELHHRVKNNLALVSGMLELQAMNEEDANIRHKLMDGTIRIKTIARIHDLLYRSKNLSRIDIAESLRKLQETILKTVQPDKDIRIHYQIQPTGTVNINQAIPFFLLVNEITTNCVRHAFNGKNEGNIHTKLDCEEDVIRLDISDDGRGFPDEFDPSGDETTGMQLIRALSRQLKADTRFTNREPGATVTFQFRMKEAKGSHSGL